MIECSPDIALSATVRCIDQVWDDLLINSGTGVFSNLFRTVLTMGGGVITGIPVPSYIVDRRETEKCDEGLV